MEETHLMEHPGRSRVSSGNPEAGPGKKRSEYELTERITYRNINNLSGANPGMSAHYPEAYPGRQ